MDPLRAMFIKRVSRSASRRSSKRSSGRRSSAAALRADLDPKLTVLSMISLGLFPFLALPVTSKVFGVRQDEEFLQRFIQHTTELLARGIAGPRAPEKKS